MARDHELRAANYAGFWAGLAETKRLANEEAVRLAEEERERRRAEYEKRMEWARGAE